MDRIKIKKALKGDQKGCWEQLPGHKNPTVYCPNCGGGLLGGFSSHRFEKNGDVNNSVICPCGFHEFITLEEFEEKIRVGVISNKGGFEKLKSNPLYSRFDLCHLQKASDVVGEFDLVIKIQNPGMIDEGASDAVRSTRLMIWNKVALYEWAKELESE